MKTYIRWIRWNGRQMIAHPVKYALAAWAFNVGTIAAWAYYKNRKTP